MLVATTMALRLVLHQVHFLVFVNCLLSLDLSEATSTLRMQTDSLTVNEGGTVDVCVVASLGVDSTAQVEVVLAMGMESSGK